MSDDISCKVNIIYMSSDGKVLSTDTLSGENGTEYKTGKIEFDGYNLSKIPDNAKGTYSDAEQTVLYIYNPVSFAAYIPAVIVIVLSAAVVIFLFVLYYKRRKAFLMKSIDIS